MELIILIIIIAVLGKACDMLETAGKNTEAFFSSTYHFVSGNYLYIISFLFFCFSFVFFLAQKEEILKLKKDDIMPPQEAETSNDNLPKSKIINLDEINLLEFYRIAKNKLNSNEPIIFKGWHNKRLKLDLERLNIINSYLESLSATEAQLQKIRATAFLSQKIFESNLIAFEEELKLNSEMLKLESAKIYAEREHLDIATKAKYAELQRYNKETEMFELKQKAEILLIEAKSEEAKAKALFINKILEKINIDNLSPTLQTYITSAILNPQGSQFEDFDIKEQIKGYLVEQEEAKTRKLSAGAMMDEAQANKEKAEADKLIKLIKNND